MKTSFLLSGIILLMSTSCSFPGGSSSHEVPKGTSSTTVTNMAATDMIEMSSGSTVRPITSNDQPLPIQSSGRAN